jgi:hypothetical protein
MKFQKGNSLGGRKHGTKNKIDKEGLVLLVNLCIGDLNARFDSLKNYEKIKLIIAFKDIYRDALTDAPTDEPRVFNINIVQEHE